MGLVWMSQTSGCLQIHRKFQVCNNSSKFRQHPCRRAAGWTLVGQTKGQGKMDRFNQNALSIKDIWLKPLQKDWRQILNA